MEANPEYIIKVSAPDVYSSYYPPTQEEHKAIKEEIMSRPGWDEIDAVKMTIYCCCPTMYMEALQNL